MNFKKNVEIASGTIICGREPSRMH